MPSPTAASSAGTRGGWSSARARSGNRSILTDPRRAEMKDILNARIKHREPFRPFAPAMLEERTGEYFDKAIPRRSCC